MESIIRDSIMEHMSKNNLLNSQQYGFVSGRSTVLQLIKVMDRWTEILDKGGCVDVVYCDFLKAFNKVPHKRLVQKLNYYGIAPLLVNWIKEFLSDRKQKVMVNGECSTWYEVTSGIPQGSVLGPTLFVVYINSLPDVISQSSSYLFADDIKLANGIFENSDCEALQSDLNNMVEWTEKSLLKFHPDKCVHMTIGKSKLNERNNTLGHNGPVIRKVKEEKDIGIIFDAELKLSTLKILNTRQLLGIYSCFMQKRNILNPHHETKEMSSSLLKFLFDWSSIDVTMRAFTRDCSGKNNASLMTSLVQQLSTLQ